MQTFGRLTLPSGTITVMVRQSNNNATHRYLCMTTKQVSEKNIGISLTDEALFLKDRPDLVRKLLDGKTLIL